MVVSFLQQRQRLMRYKSSLGPPGSRAELSWNLGSLLLDFFQLYGVQFNYFHTGISISNGGEYFQKRERSKGTADWVRNSILYVLLVLVESINSYFIA